jgi:hypothetical protein
MNEKYSLKIIQHGKTQQVRIVQNGAGIAGQAVVIQATDASRFQIVNVVTLVSPKKLQLKRVGDALHLVVPGGDIDAPDLVIQDYFKVKGASLQGSSISGEWMNYDTENLIANSVPSTTATTDIAQSAVDKTSTVTLGGAGVLGTFAEHPWLWAGGIAGVAAAASGGGGGGASGSADTTPDALTIIANYAGNSGTTTPTSANYTAAGVTLPTVSNTTDILNSMNAVVASKATADVNTADKLNALAASLKTAYEKILAEANGAISDATSGVNPALADYVSVGVAVSAQTKTLDLLNNAIGELATTNVDTLVELKTLAATANTVMTLAAVATGGATPTLTQTDAELISGLNALLGGSSAVTTSNLADIKTLLIDTADDGVGIATVTQLKAIVALQVLRDYANATNGVGVVAPTLTTYKDAGVKALTNLSEVDTAASSDIDSATITSALGVTSAAWLTTLNSALDKRTDGNSLTAAQVQAMAASYYRILSEADGVVNTASNIDVNGGGVLTNDDPIAADYVAIGSTIGNVKSVDLLNDFVGLSVKTAVDTVDEINSIAKAAYNVMRQANVTAVTGIVPATYGPDADWVTGLTALGINGVTTGNITSIKAAITGTATLGTANDGLEVDTVQELKDLVNPIIAQQILKNYTDTNGASTVPTLTDYTNAGIKTFKSLSDTGVTNRKALNDSSTAGGAESNTYLTADILNTALDKLTGSSLTYDTIYTGTVQKMVDAYYRILREADGKYVGDTNGGASYYDGSTTAKTADTDVYNDTNNDATNATNFNDPRLEDYTAIGVTVDDAINGTSYNSTTGVGNETLDLLNDAIGRIGAAVVDTAGKVQTLSTSANDVMLLAKGTATSASQTDANLITGLNLFLGLTTTTGLNTNNISAVKADIVATNDNGTGVDTVNELLGLLALVRLKEFTDDGGALGSKTSSTPTLNDWALAGTGLTSNTTLTDGARLDLNQATYWKSTNSGNGLNALNSALDTYAGSLVNQPLLQNVVDAYGRVLQEADGSRATATDVKFIDSAAGTGRGSDVTQADLEFLRVNKGGADNGTTVSTDTGLYYQRTGELLASAIGSLASSAVDTVGELNTLVGYAEAVMKQAAGVTFSYTDGEWVTALNALFNTNTSTGVNINNIADIKTAITTAAVIGVDTWDELQALVSLVRLDDYAAISTGWTTPTLTDYQAVANANGATDAYSTTSVTTKSVYLASYNDAVNAQSSISSGAVVKDMLVAYTALLDSADGNRSSTTATLASTSGTAVAEFADIWGVSPTTTEAATLLNDVISGLTTSSIDQVSELIAMATTANKIMTVAGGVTPQSITRQELTNLGLNDGAGHSFTDWNSGTGAYWINDVEYGRFIATSGTGSIGAAGGVGNVNSWQELQNVVNAAIINA